MGRLGRMWSSGSSGEEHFGPGAVSCERTFSESESEHGLVVFSGSSKSSESMNLHQEGSVGSL